MKKKKIVVGYCRVSTGNQKEEGTIEIQQSALKEFAKSKGYELVKIFSDDGVSGDLKDRPELAKLFDYVETYKDINGILIFRLDRLSRDLMIQENLVMDFKKRGLQLISTKEPNLNGNDPTRVFIRQVLGATSQYEKAMITMRLSGGRLNKARKGGYAGGGLPYGYKADKKELRLDSERSETIKTIFSLKRSRMSIRGIAQYLNDTGVTTARGKKWYASTVKYILENPIYKGKICYKGIKVANGDLAIV
jgi:site-specific DNA recombinase